MLSSTIGTLPSDIDRLVSGRLRPSCSIRMIFSANFAVGFGVPESVRFRGFVPKEGEGSLTDDGVAAFECDKVERLNDAHFHCEGWL